MSLENYVLPEGKALGIRTCDKDLKSHGGFQWPESGYVKCPDWNPQAVCGGGLHFILDGIGNFGLLSNDIDAKWLIIEVERKDVVQIDQEKAKAPEANVIYCGDMATAMTYIGKHYIRLMIEAAGDKGVEAASGHSSKLAASGHSSKLAASGDSSKLAASGDSSKLAASGDSSNLAASGDSSNLAASGDSSKLAASGDSSKLAASGHYSNLAASGHYSNLAASGDYSNLAASGKSSKLAASGKSSLVMAAGIRSSGQAGEKGCIALSWWSIDEERYRVEVAYVGENGIEPNVAYTLDEDHKFVRTK